MGCEILERADGAEGGDEVVVATELANVTSPHKGAPSHCCETQMPLTTLPLHLGYPPDEELAGRTVTIRRTRDSYVPQPEYIAYSQVALDDNGWLDLGNLGLGAGGNDERYLLVTEPGRPVGKCFGPMAGWGKLLPSWRVRDALEYAGDNVITVTTFKDKRNVGRQQWRAKLYENRGRSVGDWVEWARQAVEQWFEEAPPGPAGAMAHAVVPNTPEGGGAATGGGGGNVVPVKERPNALVGNGPIRRRGGKLKID